MSMPDPTPPRKPSRLGLYIPFALLLLIVAGWSVFWLWARGETARRLDAGAQSLRSGGYEVTWTSRSIGGYPFRLNVALTDVQARDRSGWALEAPKAEAQALLHAPTHWIVAAPDGLTFVRPLGGPVRVGGDLLRASFSHMDDTPPNISFEGTKLTFQPAAGAQPFGLTAAERVEFHVRRAPKEVGDEAGLWLLVKDGRAAPASLLGRVAGARPVSIEWDARLSHAQALTGRDWAHLVRRWTAAGGKVSVKRGGLTAGEALLGVNSGSLGVGPDGRLTGVMDVSLRRAPQALAALGAGGGLRPDSAAAAIVVAEARAGAGDVATATLHFEAGRTTLGPVAIAPAPKIFDPR
jgi:hypothetical protein